MLTITIAGNQYPVHFGLRGLSTFTKKTGISFGEIVTAKDAASSLDGIVALGVLGLNEGARKSGNPQARKPSQRMTSGMQWTRIRGSFCRLPMPSRWPSSRSSISWTEWLTQTPERPDPSRVLLCMGWLGKGPDRCARRQEWERTRWQTWVLTCSWMEKKDRKEMTEMFPLPWENAPAPKIIKPSAELTPEERQKRIDELMRCVNSPED